MDVSVIFRSQNHFHKHPKNMETPKDLEASKNIETPKNNDAKEAKYPHTHTCCGVEFVKTKPSPTIDWKTPRDKCLQTCNENRAPIQFQHAVYVAVWITLFVVAIIVIAKNQQVINECRDEFKGQAQLDCLLDSKTSVGEYAIGFCLLFGSALGMARVLLWLFHKRFRTWIDQPHEPFKCVDGKPNKDLQKRIFWIIHIILFFLFLFMAAYFAQFAAVKECKNNDQDCHDSSNQGGYIVGLIAGVGGVVVTAFIGALNYNEISNS